MNIKGIKKRLKTKSEYKVDPLTGIAYFVENPFNTVKQLESDVSYLLSIIEQAEKALDRVYMNHGYIYVSEALQAIRKGD